MHRVSRRSRVVSCPFECVRRSWLIRVRPGRAARRVSCGRLPISFGFRISRARGRARGSEGIGDACCIASRDARLVTTDDSRFFRVVLFDHSCVKSPRSRTSAGHRRTRGPGAVPSMEGRGSRSARISRFQSSLAVEMRNARWSRSAEGVRTATSHKAPPETRRDPPPAQRTGAQWAVDVGCAAVPRDAAAHLERSLPCVVSTRLTSVAMAHLAALSVPTTWPADVADHRRRAQDKDLQSTL